MVKHSKKGDLKTEKKEAHSNKASFCNFFVEDPSFARFTFNIYITTALPLLILLLHRDLLSLFLLPSTIVSPCVAASSSSPSSHNSNRWRYSIVTIFFFLSPSFLLLSLLTLLLWWWRRWCRGCRSGGGEVVVVVVMVILPFMMVVVRRLQMISYIWFG
ncbi:hypothetical protein PIB30_104765 [Stylosanthes scabra]|uniref:Transmembrane protein n=1 Tax=Stylosanthes scabra TaxID=79078 RepID=A0ABU6RYY3_9FABA|nr:hypothetical protein [Stylosanthes scabra]